MRNSTHLFIRRAAPMRARLYFVCLCGLLFFAPMLTSCTAEYDFERAEQARGTLGEELYGIWHKDAVRAAENSERKTMMLESRKDEFIAAVDAVAPPEKLEEVDTFLQEMLSLIDSGLIQGLTRKLQAILRDAVANDALLSSIAIQNRPKPGDFLSPVSGQNFLGHLMGYPRMPDVAARTSQTLLAADGLDADGNPDMTESTALRDVLNAATVFLGKSERVQPTDTVAYSLQNVLATEDERFAENALPRPLYAVAYDRRGRPLVAKDGSGIAPPFADFDNDGLADIDVEGKWVLAAGGSKNIPAFRTTVDASALLNRDPYGRAHVGSSGKYSFEYVDLSKTGVHFMVRQFDALAKREILWNLVDAAPALLGPRQINTDSQGAFSGYSSDSPMRDIFYALLHILDIDTLDRVLAASADFLATNSHALAGLVFALNEAVEVVDEFNTQYPDAGLNDNQTLAYDMLPVLEAISADPDLWRDVLWALRQPITQRTGEPMAMLLSYKDSNPAVPAANGPYDSCFQACDANFPIFETFNEANPQSCVERYKTNQALQRYECVRACPNGEMFSEPMDYSLPETQENISMFQRMFHLLRDTTGSPYNLKMLEPASLSSMPAIIELPSSSEAFLRAVGSSMDMADYVPNMAELQPLLDMMGGSSSLANLLSQLSPIFGVELSRRATPPEITRMFNKADLSGDLGQMGTARITTPTCKDGHVMANHHADMLYAAEASGMIDTIAPLACAFAANDQEELMTRLFVITHEHYSGKTDLNLTADGTVSESKGSNLRSLEPALRDILEKKTLFKALYELSVAAERVESQGVVPDFTEQLRVLVHHAVRSDDGFRGANGEDSITLADGRTLRNLSRATILLEAGAKMNARVEGDPVAEEALGDIFSAVTDVLLAAEWPEGAPMAQFSDPGTIAVMERLTRHLSGKAAELQAEGRLSEWLTEEQLDNFGGLFDSRALPALVDLSGELVKNPQDRELVDDLLDYMLGEPAGRDQVAMGLYVLLVYTLHQDTWVPVSNFMARTLDPNRTWQVEPYGKLPLASHVLQVLQETVEKDPQGRGIELFARGFSNMEDGSVPFGTIFEIVADYFRADPASLAPYTPGDYRVVLNGLESWLDDDLHGLERLYDIVDP
ncbi:hypothetical protein [Bradymonas sediminis]|nr:hypothetical protein [Bradymonas sediminis]TDP75372.1 hypothetical protein DFR33_104237 [Bradymonas sediminis]